MPIQSSHSLILGVSLIYCPFQPSIPAFSSNPATQKSSLPLPSSHKSNSYPPMTKSGTNIMNHNSPICWVWSPCQKLYQMASDEDSLQFGNMVSETCVKSVRWVGLGGEGEVWRPSCLVCLADGGKEEDGEDEGLYAVFTWRLRARLLVRGSIVFDYQQARVVSNPSMVGVYVSDIKPRIINKNMQGQPNFDGDHQFPRDSSCFRCAKGSSLNSCWSPDKWRLTFQLC